MKEESAGLGRQAIYDALPDTQKNPFNPKGGASQEKEGKKRGRWVTIMGRKVFMSEGLGKHGKRSKTPEDMKKRLSKLEAQHQRARSVGDPSAAQIKKHIGSLKKKMGVGEEKRPQSRPRRRRLWRN